MKQYILMSNRMPGYCLSNVVDILSNKPKIWDVNLDNARIFHSKPDELAQKYDAFVVELRG